MTKQTETIKFNEATIGLIKFMLKDKGLTVAGKRRLLKAIDWETTRYENANLAREWHGDEVAQQTFEQLKSLRGSLQSSLAHEK